MHDFDPSFPDLIRLDPRDRDPWMRLALWLSAFFWLLLALLFRMIPLVSGIPFLVLAFVTMAMASTRMARWINTWERYLPYRWRSWLRTGVKLPHRRLRPPLP